MKKTLIYNAMILKENQNSEIIDHGYIVITDSIITEVNNGDPAHIKGYAQVINAQDKLVMPGLINGHCHSYANYTKGLAPTIPLEHWMVYVMAQGELLTPEDMYWNAMLGSLEMIQSGTTCCVDHLAQGYDSLDAAMQAYEDSGMRAAIAPMIADKPYVASLPIAVECLPRILDVPTQPAETLLDSTGKLYKKWHGVNDRLKVFLGPSGPQRCSDELLSEAGRLAKQWQTGFHSHVLETKEQARAANLFYQEPMLFHLDKLGCLNENTMLVHAVWLTDEEIALTAKKDAVVVHNPSSNFVLGSGIAPINRYLGEGVTVTLGTDGVNVSGSHSMFGAVRLAALIHNFSNPRPETWVQPADVIRMATQNGARAFVDKRLGRIEAGAKADIIILALDHNCIMSPLNNVRWQVAYSDPSALVESVFVNGEAVMINRQFLNVDEEKILHEAKVRGDRLRKKFYDAKYQEVLSKIAAIKQIYQ